MGRKKKLKIPKSALIKCPHCSKRSRVPVSENDGLYHYECKKCKHKLEIPASQCCLICAYSNKECALTLKRKFKN